MPSLGHRHRLGPLRLRLRLLLDLDLGGWKESKKRRRQRQHRHRRPYQDSPQHNKLLHLHRRWRALSRPALSHPFLQQHSQSRWNNLHLHLHVPPNNNRPVHQCLVLHQHSQSRWNNLHLPPNNNRPVHQCPFPHPHLYNQPRENKLY